MLKPHHVLYTQAKEQAEKLEEQRKREEQENLAEMWHTMTSDMMTECAEATERQVGGGRPPQVLPDRWKGMSPEQLKRIQQEREQQCLERQVLHSVLHSNIVKAAQGIPYMLCRIPCPHNPLSSEVASRGIGRGKYLCLGSACVDLKLVFSFLLFFYLIQLYQQQFTTAVTSKRFIL